MLKNKILEKLLAIILIFTLTFANFAFVTECLATTMFDSIFGEKADTGHKNVEFEAYFGTEDEKSHSVISDVNNKDLSLSLDLNVKDSGYLKDAKVEIKEAEEGAGLNYVLKSGIELSEMVQSLDNNILEFRQINNNSEQKINLPIEYKNEDYINENKLSKDSKVVFSGIYVDDNGEEIEVSREIILNVSWKDERKVKLESLVTKYIQFGNENKGVILQTSVKVDSTSEENTLPVKETKLDVEVPKLNGNLPTNITLVATSTQGTNGKFAEDIKFDDTNWIYNQETNTISIKVENEKTLVKVNEFEDEYLKDIDQKIIEEERYYSKSGIDEFLITYTYENVEPQEEMNVSSNVTAEVTTFSGVENDERIYVVKDNQNYEYNLVGQTGDIVSYNIENETNEISKAYTYLNYNTDNDYEIEYKFKNIINISIKDLVEEMIIEDVEENYVFKDGNAVGTNDLYYKEISMNKDNINDILGEDGVIDILDVDGNVITSINKEYPVTEDGKIVVNFENRYEKIVLKTTKPVNEGNLSINYTKVSKDASIDKNTYKDLEKVTSKLKMSARYAYVQDLVEIGEAISETKLNDTVTKLNLVLDRDNLSTITRNENVEIRIELNNHKETSDIFGNTIFEVLMPEYITNLEIVDLTMVYGEGLEIVNSEVVNENGIYKIRIEVNGKQEALNSGVLTNGANIEIYANIDIDLYAPAKEESVKLYFLNKEATNVETDFEEVKVNYSAPTGLVAVNSTANYNNVGNVLTSVRQGKKEDILEIYSDAKQATMDIVIMNNNKNSVSELSILGRIPFTGVKNIENGEDLGTTVDTRLVQGIVSDSRNNGEFRVYYSENKEATKDLNDSQNGWVENPESLENMKSYLIVPIDENYEMQEAQILRFTYIYEIPADLTHNENIYGTFLAYYKNNSEIAITDEVSSPDVIGLTTGAGPELSIETSTNVEKISEFEELKITSKVSNTGKEVVENIEVNIPIPKYSKFSEVELENQNIQYTVNNDSVTFYINNLDVEKEENVSAKVIINNYPTIEEYYKNTEGFMRLEDGTYVIRTYDEEDSSHDSNGEPKYNDQIISKTPAVEIEIYSTVKAKDLQRELKSDIKKVEIESAEFEIIETTEYAEVINTPGREVDYNVSIRNITESTKNNLVVTKQIPEGLSFSSAYGLEYEEDGLTSRRIDNASYDESTRTITWRIDSLNPKIPKQVVAKLTVDDITDGSLEKDIYLSTKVVAEGTKTYESNTVKTRVGKPSLEITQSSSTTNTYVKEGDVVNYTFIVRNNGPVEAYNVKLTDQIPDGLIVRKISYTANGISATRRISSKNEAVINATIEPSNELVANIEALAVKLDGVQEKTVTNMGTVIAEGMPEVETNAITHIIEADTSRGNGVVEKSNTSLGNSNSSNANSNIVKTYKVSGVAWLDDNKDGKRDEYEPRLTDIKASLVDVNTGYIVKNVTTDSKGTYTFSGVEEGNYLVMFEYDTVKYTVSTYQRSDVEANVNSDAIVTQVEQNGKKKNVAVTDTISVQNGSISNIDIGLVLADTFDLKLDKTITKITAQNKAGTVNQSYDNTQLAKIDIAGKYLSSTVVYIEYKIAVSNVGDIAGYAKKIVDYIPEGMTFKSELNPDWYTGNDGMLYTTALENVELKTGETKEIKLVLTKQMTEENTGMINNIAEIYEDYNIYGVSDKNSTPGNKVQNENDMSSADTIITVKTGEVFIHISVIIVSILLGSIVIFISYNKLIVNKRKGGV